MIIIAQETRQFYALRHIQMGEAVMSLRQARAVILTAVSLTIAACGGGGGGGVASIPSPPSTPTPTPTPGVTNVFMKSTPATQEFASAGATFSEVAFPTYDGPLAAPGDQLRIRYDANSKKYAILEPQTSEWRQVMPDPSTSPSGAQWKTANGDVQIHINNDLSKSYEASLYSYSALVEWRRTDMDRRGVTAFGVPSDSAAIPVSGNATFDGAIYGFTNETWDYGADWGHGVGNVSGSIQLKFDFGAGALSGSISPKVYANEQYALPTMSFVDTVNSSGSTTFSGRFDTPVSGANAFSGRFTGPQANELMGNFVFPYNSLLDGKEYEAGGGFIAKH